MITISSFPANSRDNDNYEEMRHHSDVEEDVLMDALEDEDDNWSDARLTSPGAPLTSSHAFMRYVPSV